MQTIFQKFSLLLLAIPFTTMAQNQGGNYTTLPLQDWSSFEAKPANWSLQSDISVTPFAGSKPKLSAGNGILVGQAGQVISSKLKAQDLKLSLEFMVTPGSEGYLILPGGQKLLIKDSSQDQVANALTSGYLGQFPIQNAAKSPGLWQTLELSYDAKVPHLTNTARLNTLSMNGVNILETVYLPLNQPILAGESISLEVTKGSIAFKNIGYQLLENRKPLQINNLTYKVYADKWDSKTYSKLDHEGKGGQLTQEVNNGMKEFHLVYEGDMDVAEQGDYRFTNIYSGPLLTLEIDGKMIFNGGESTSQESHTATVSLTQGKHTFKLHYSRFPWRRPALGMSVEKAGIRQYNLHAISSLPEPEPKPYISVSPDQQTEMIRSFIQLDGEKYKRTHCISIGMPEGWSYTLDLNRGALLQAWRGQFANVTEMWYERGEPQLLFPAGLMVPVSGKSSFATLASETEAWPDSANLNFQGYKLDAKGIPTFRYSMAETQVNDKFTATQKGIHRTFSLENPVSNLYSLIASGKDIKMIEKGLYQIDNLFYVQVDKKTKVIVRPNSDQKELILPVVSGTSYTMFW